LFDGITLGLALTATGYMLAPALANVLTRTVTREGWHNTFLRPRLIFGLPFWVAAWFLPVILSVAGAFVFFAIFPQYFDSNLTILNNQLEAGRAAGQNIPFSAPVLLVLIMLGTTLVVPLANGLFTFGEEFGWRAYLQPKLMPLGGRKAMLLMGVIWGVWHWPIIAMGHNYGFDYPGYPWTGMLMMVVLTLVLGTIFGWLTLRGGSVWPAVIAHASINGVAGFAILLTVGTPSPLLGPLPVGIIGMIPAIALAAWLMLTPGHLEARTPPAPASAAPEPSAENG
jgi:membrane protease YdiL (CAAX protease family)